jgi:hypothetical protein
MVAAHHLTQDFLVHWSVKLRLAGDQIQLDQYRWQSSRSHTKIFTVELNLKQLLLILVTHCRSVGIVTFGHNGIRIIDLGWIRINRVRVWGIEKLPIAVNSV